MFPRQHHWREVARVPFEFALEVHAIVRHWLPAARNHYHRWTVGYTVQLGSLRCVRDDQAGFASTEAELDGLGTEGREKRDVLVWA